MRGAPSPTLAISLSEHSLFQAIQVEALRSLTWMVSRAKAALDGPLAGESRPV